MRTLQCLKKKAFYGIFIEEKDENKILESSCSEETYSLENHKNITFKILMNIVNILERIFMIIC